MPKGIFKRHLDISSILLTVIQVPLLTTSGPLGPLKNLHLIYYRGNKSNPSSQTCSGTLSEVSNESEEVMVIQLLFQISTYTFVHQSEVTQTMLLVTPMCLKAWSKIRTILMENQDIPITYVFYRMKANYHLPNPKLVSLCWCFTTRQPHGCDHLHTERGCRQDHFPATLHSAPGSCSVLYTLQHESTQKASPASGKHHNRLCPKQTSSSGFPQSTTNSYFYAKQQTMTLTAAHTRLPQQSSYKALQLEQEDQAIRWKPPHFTLSAMQFCIS